jgi:hypothetical protein
MQPLENRVAMARMVQQVADNRAASLAAEKNAAPTVTPEQQEMSTSQLFRQQFGHQREPKHYDRQEAPRESTWDALLRAGADDDTPRPPEPATVPLVAPQPEPAPEPPAEETRARQTGSADELFTHLEARLSHTPEAVNLPPDVQLRRAFRELPGTQREQIAKLIEREDFGLVGYFDGRNFQPDYVAVLVGSALGKRFADAQRLQPELTPAQLLEQIIKAAG